MGKTSHIQRVREQYKNDRQRFRARFGLSEDEEFWQVFIDFGMFVHEYHLMTPRDDRYWKWWLMEYQKIVAHILQKAKPKPTGNLKYIMHLMYQAVKTATLEESLINNYIKPKK